MVVSRLRFLVTFCLALTVMALFMRNQRSEDIEEYLQLNEKRAVGLQDDTASELGEDNSLAGISPCQVKGLERVDQYVTYLLNAETSCQMVEQFGGQTSAGGTRSKFMCLDKRYNIKPNDCVVLSYGVSSERSFEDDVDKFGCKMYTADATTYKANHQRSPHNGKFAASGSNAANHKPVNRMTVVKKWNMQKVDRLENLMNRLGLAGKEIDYIKLNMALGELDFLRDLLNSPSILKNIKQIGMEVDGNYFTGDLSQRSTQQVFWPYFMLLRCNGFKVIHVRARPEGQWEEVIWAQEHEW